MELSKIVNCLFWTTCQCIFSTGRAPAYGARAIVYCTCMVYIIFSGPAGQPHKLMIFTITPTCNRSYESHFRFSKQTHVLLQTGCSVPITQMKLAAHCGAAHSLLVTFQFHCIARNNYSMLLLAGCARFRKA